jgi:beta-lactamase regulating signal transducer with metallopeptidase domain
MNMTFPHTSIAGLPLVAVGILGPIVAGLMAEFACRLSGRASAAARHLIWTLGFVMMAVCVPVTLFPIKVAVPILPAKSVERTSTAVSQLMVKDLSDAGARHAAKGISDSRTNLAATPHSMTHLLRDQPWQRVLLSLWLAGFLFLLFTVLVGTLRLRGIVKRSRSVEDQAALWTELLSLTGLRQSTRLRVSPEVRIPIVTGLLRPIVILPEAALQWPAPMFRAALIHELAHLRRNDLRCSTFAWLVVSIYWFNPAAWYGLRRLQGQAEMAADDDVVVTESQPIAYAESLLTLVRTLRGNGASLFPTIGMLQGRSIEARVERILDQGRHRLGPPKIVRLGTIFCGALATAIVLMVRPVAALAPPVPPALLAAKVNAPQTVNADTPDNGETPIKTESDEAPAITDLRTQLPGTRWKATPANPLRGGLAAILSFNEKTVDPAGYPYEVNRHDATVRIFFNHGDTQLLLLTNDGRRLRFTFGGKDYAYELTAQ